MGRHKFISDDGDILAVSRMPRMTHTGNGILVVGFDIYATFSLTNFFWSSLSRIPVSHFSSLPVGSLTKKRSRRHDLPYFSFPNSRLGTHDAKLCFATFCVLTTHRLNPTSDARHGQRA